MAQHLSLWPRRDVIETPLEGELDVNGWDLAKALKLLLKGNAVILEWLTSPIVYRGEAWFRADFLGFAECYASRELVQRHYLHLGERQRRQHLDDAAPTVALKKLFYVLRPAAALRWLRSHPAARLAPMHFPTLMAQCDPPAAVAGLVAEMIARKAITRELGAAPLPAAVRQFIESEFDIARNQVDEGLQAIPEAGREAAERFYRKTVTRVFAS